MLKVLAVCLVSVLALFHHAEGQTGMKEVSSMAT